MRSRSRHALFVLALAALTAVPIAGLDAGAAGAAVAGAPRWPYALQSGSTAALVKWAAPASDGGSPITGYVVTPYKGGVAQPSRTYPRTQTGVVLQYLATGKAYRFTVAAINADGTGPASTMSATIFIGAPGRPVTYVKTWVSGWLIVHMSPPANNGANISLTTAKCTSSDGGVTGLRTNGGYNVYLSGLTVGKTYTCTTAATNSRGTGIRSAPSAPIVVP